VSGWIAQRECAVCHYAGPETEFMAVGLLDEALVIVHRDQQAEGFEVYCLGCVSALGRSNPRALSDLVRDLLASQAAL